MRPGFIYRVPECKATAISAYENCSFRCVYCSSEAQGKSKAIVKLDEIPGLIESQLKKNNMTLAVGGHTDPYPDIEDTKFLTREIIKTLIKKKREFKLITKGLGVLRDADLLKSRYAKVIVSAGITDENSVKTLEPGAPSFKARYELVKKLKEAGVNVEWALAPIIPEATDFEKILELAIPGVNMFVIPLMLEPLKFSARDRYFPGSPSALKVFGDRYTQKHLNSFYIDLYKKYKHKKNILWRDIPSEAFDPLQVGVTLPSALSVQSGLHKNLEDYNARQKKLILVGNDDAGVSISTLKNLVASQRQTQQIHCLHKVKFLYNNKKYKELDQLIGFALDYYPHSPYIKSIAQERGIDLKKSPGFQSYLQAKNFYANREYKKCITVLNQIQSRYGYDLETNFIKSNCYKQSGSLSKAIEVMRHALNCAPQNKKTKIQLAKLLIEDGHYVQALKLLSKLQAPFLKAFCYYKDGQLEPALKIVTGLLVENPFHIEARILKADITDSRKNKLVLWCCKLLVKLALDKPFLVLYRKLPA